MTRFRRITKVTLSLTLSLFLGLPLVALADVKTVQRSVKTLADIVKSKEKAAKDGAKLEEGDCNAMRAALESARKELAQAQTDHDANVVNRNNSDGPKLGDAAADIDNLAGRIDALCPPPPPAEDEKSGEGKGDKGEGDKDSDKKNDGKDSGEKSGDGKDPGGKDGGEKDSGEKKSPEAPQGPDNNPSGEKSGEGKQQSPEVGTIPGVVTIALETRKGQVKLTLPADMRAGDTISGTVIAEPMGKNSAERARNQDELNGYVVELERAKTSVMGKSLTWAIPAALGGTGTYVILKDGKGKEVARRAVPVQSNAQAIERHAVPAPGDYQFPTIGQAGRPLQIGGPFDGDFGTTSLKVGGQEVKKLAESPRACLFESPTNIAGPTQITLKEENIETRGEYRNVGVRLSAPKTDLLKGEHTALTVEVEGLEGIREEIPLRFANFSPAVVHMEGGDTQTMNVRPEDVRPGGNFTVTRGLTGKQAGAFQISVTVLACSPVDGPVDMNGVDSVDELMEKLEGKSKEQKRRKLNATLEALNVAKKHNEKHGYHDPDLDEKIRIVEMALKRVG